MFPVVSPDRVGQFDAGAPGFHHFTLSAGGRYDYPERRTGIESGYNWVLPDEAFSLSRPLVMISV